MKLFLIEFYSGHSITIFAKSKKDAYGKALGLGQGRIVDVIEVEIN
jgi:hypothetical protein